MNLVIVNMRPVQTDELVSHNKGILNIMGFPDNAIELIDLRADNLGEETPFIKEFKNIIPEDMIKEDINKTFISYIINNSKSDKVLITICEPKVILENKEFYKQLQHRCATVIVSYGLTNTDDIEKIAEYCSKYTSVSKEDMLKECKDMEQFIKEAKENGLFIECTPFDAEYVYGNKIEKY